MFQVFDNEIPAQHPYFAVQKSWDNSQFDTFEEAADYAKRWLVENCDAAAQEFELNVPVKYNGHDEVVIRKVEE